MKSSVEKLSDTRVKLTVEVPFDELGKEIDSAYKAIAEQVTIKGFRRGKAPRQLIEARYGRGPILEQVVNDVIPSRYSAAVDEQELAVIGQPDIEVTALEDNERIEFTAEVDVRPEITLPSFADYAVEVEPLADTEEKVGERLEMLQRRFATQTPVEREAAEGDVLAVKLESTIDGEAVADLSQDGMTITLGSEEVIPGLENAVTGKKAGETATFTTSELKHPEYEGKEVEVTVTVDAVKEVVLPELNDDFAEEASEYDTLDELKVSIRSEVEESVKADQAAEIRDKVLTKALEESEFALPESLVEQQVQGQLQQLLNQLGGDEKVMESLLKAQGMSREEYDKNSREQAEKAIRTQLLLDALADEVKPEVHPDELRDHVLFTAQAYGMDPNTFMMQLQQAGQLGNLYADVRRGKALADAICKVKVTDTAGNAIDPATYFGEEESDEAADNTSDEAKDAK
ncbi:trigger factor [Corynebacterium choanae]|uniref:Trigger factor n=1 Tax=Corynebacterium choanae TaxID=1862358 RepID=A0A3G6J8J7_9CORY|nr:trigger factor [Corynebacterium choanae]AZA14132.1 Trigger factor [Corynebacterium choanae]